MSEKILYCWLGMTDLRVSRGELGEGALGPIGQAAHDMRFSEIHLLSDMDDVTNTAYFEWLQQLTDATITIHACKLSSPMNFSEIYEAVSSVLKNGSADTLSASFPSPGSADTLSASFPSPGSADTLSAHPKHTDNLSATPEWHSRGYLPHRDKLNLLQSITFRLADSLPADKLKRMDEELHSLPENERTLERRKKIEKWLDSGKGSCVLAHPELAEIMQETLLKFDGEKYKLIAWCIMPNHVHTLIEPYIELGKIVQSWKTYTSKWFFKNRERLEEELPTACRRSRVGEELPTACRRSWVGGELPAACRRSRVGEELPTGGRRSRVGEELPTGGRRSREVKNHLWMREYWDRYIRDEKHFKAVVEYINNNPVKAGLCATPQEWRWSGCADTLSALSICKAVDAGDEKSQEYRQSIEGAKVPTACQRSQGKELPTACRRSREKSCRQSVSVPRVFHISPGTSAMAAIWIILSKTEFPADLIQSSPEEGVKVISIPFDISADFNPAIALATDDDILRISRGLPPQSPEFGEISHKCAAMRDAVVKSRLVAMHDIPVLIHGESGTGKELFARAIHTSSLRKSGPFVEVNCGAIPEQLFESEFFGHEKGAFTGADRMKKGYVESADGGTLFLDEIAELPLHAQVKLLRMLQERSVVRVGAATAIPVNIRIIAATNKNLAAEVADGNFREDLFHRLAIGVLNLPPLRDRKGDLNLLIDKFMTEINREFRGIHGDEWIDRKLSVNARSALISHQWPGNIRELRNTLLRLVLWCPHATIGVKDVEDAMFATSPGKRDKTYLDAELLKTDSFCLENLLGEVAVNYIEEALRMTDGNRRKAASILGFSNYQTMNNWIKKYAGETSR